MSWQDMDKQVFASLPEEAQKEILALREKVDGLVKQKSYRETEKYMRVYTALLSGMQDMYWTTDEYAIVKDTLHTYLQRILFPALGKLCEGMEVDCSDLDKVSATGESEGV